jgi:hypothetical protein
LELERLDTEIFSARLATVGFTLDQFPEIVDLIPIKVFESAPELALRQRDG